MVKGKGRGRFAPLVEGTERVRSFWREGYRQGRGAGRGLLASTSIGTVRADIGDEEGAGIS